MDCEHSLLIFKRVRECFAFKAASFSEERRKDTTENQAHAFGQGKRPNYIMNNMPLRLINV